MTAFQFPEPNAFTAPLYEKLFKHPKRVVFPDGEDIRVARVAGRFVELGLGVPILLGRKAVIVGLLKEAGVESEFVRVIEPSASSDLDLLARRLERISRYMGQDIQDAREVVSRPMHFGAMMIQYGMADAMVAGNLTVPAGVFRPLLHLVKPLPEVPKVFGVTVLVAPHLENFGPEGILFFADTGCVPVPDVDELASIAVETGKLARHYLGRRPRVAMLSHSTMGSAQSEPVRRMQAAAARARSRVSVMNLEVDGEVQADVALDSAAAEVKVPGYERKAPADVLIFPDLDAAHISMKLLQHTAGAQNYGQLVMGLAHPAAQVPRTASEETLLGTAAAVGVEAIKSHELYLRGQNGFEGDGFEESLGLGDQSR